MKADEEDKTIINFDAQKIVGQEIKQYQHRKP